MLRASDLKFISITMIIFIILGFVSCIFQLVLIREFTFSIAKNELALMVGIGIWLISCALATFTRNKKQLLSDAGLLIALALSCGAGIGFAHLSKSILAIPYYESVNAVFAFLAALFVLGPTGALSGYAFAHLNHRHFAQSPETKDPLGYLFAYEALGIFLGGLIFTFGFSSYKNPLVFTALPLLFVPVLAISQKEKAFAVITLMVLSLFCTRGFPGILQKEFSNTSIIAAQGSPYGPIIMTESREAKSLYVNGTLAATSEDKEFHETLIHTALAARTDTATLLWIGPCVTSQAQELEKYPKLAVTAVDINPRLKNLPTFYTPGKNITYVHEDPRLFLAKNTTPYDLIILNIPSPSALLFNRFYTVEFFREAKNALSAQGVFVFSIASKPDILSPAIRDFNACLVNSFRRVFTHTFLIPGDAMIVFGSCQEITASQLTGNFDKHQAKTRFFTAFHLRDKLDPLRRSYVENALSSSAGINTDLMPYGFLYYTLMDQTRFTPRLHILPQKLKPLIFAVSLLCVGILAFVLLWRKGQGFGFQAGVIGFLAMSTSAMIFFVFQLLCGGLFWKLGILIGLFMLGLAAGSFFLSQFLFSFPVTARHLAGLFALWFLFCWEMFFWTNYRGYTLWHQLIWMVLALESGALTGFGYPLVNALWEQNKEARPAYIASFLYAADLVGACAGTLLTSALFIPFLGINLTCLILFAVIMVLGLKDWL